jgi:fido (protein-threonine AMPylation protein)
VLGEQLAVNVAHCLVAVLDGNPADIDISSGWIRDIHRRIAGELFPDWAGRYRTMPAARNISMRCGKRIAATSRRSRKAGRMNAVPPAPTFVT